MTQEKKGGAVFLRLNKKQMELIQDVQKRTGHTLAGATKFILDQGVSSTTIADIRNLGSKK